MVASRKCFVATGILVFDFELFIGGRHQKRTDNSFEMPALIVYATQITMLGNILTAEAKVPHLSSVTP
jgi:hypothetical protein